MTTLTLKLKKLSASNNGSKSVTNYKKSDITNRNLWLPSSGGWKEKK